MGAPFPASGGPTPGWYTDPQGQLRWWDGEQWGVAAPNQGGGTSDEKNLATLAQVLAIFTGFLGPLVIYLMARDDQPFAKHHAAEALNFQITVTIAVVVSFVLVFVLIGFLLLPVVMIGAFVFEVIASVAANRGEWYRFPINIRMVSGARG
jgi:uncharacterized protein